MKTFLFTAALVMGTAAIAQAGQPEAPSSMPQTATSPTPDAPAGEPSTTAQFSTAPDNAPAGAGAASTSDSASGRVASADTGNYPVCSRTVRDKCVNRGAHRR